MLSVVPYYISGYVFSGLMPADQLRLQAWYIGCLFTAGTGA